MDNAAFAHEPSDGGSESSAFPTGMQVVVTGGLYDGDRGRVVDRRPDLRPRSVWVHLNRAGVRLVPSYRLIPT